MMQQISNNSDEELNKENNAKNYSESKQM